MALTTGDLAVYLQQPVPTGDELSRMMMLANMANGLVLEVTGPLDPEPYRVQAIRLEIAARAWRNPNGYSSETVGTYTWRGDPAGRSGVYLTAAEHADLLALVAGPATPPPWSGSMAYGRTW